MKNDTKRESFWFSFELQKNKTALDSESGRGREKERAHGQDNKGH